MSQKDFQIAVNHTALLIQTSQYRAKVQEKHNSLEVELRETKSIQRYDQIAHHMQALEWVLTEVLH